MGAGRITKLTTSRQTHRTGCCFGVCDKLCRRCHLREICIFKKKNPRKKEREESPKKGGGGGGQRQPKPPNPNRGWQMEDVTPVLFSVCLYLPKGPRIRSSKPSAFFSLPVADLPIMASPVLLDYSFRKCAFFLKFGGGGGGSKNRYKLWIMNF